jgi:ABC-type Fe3+/spermidine/putrescine transport system ATPase subunit
MRQEIRELQQRLAITTVYVTHDQEEAMAVSDRIAVMSEGSVVQVGSAQDLYHRPASEFVARFVGRVNLVPARVVGVEGETCVVSALGTTLRVGAASQRFATGDAVSLLLRPEAISIDGKAAAGPIDGTVVSHAFLGEKIEYIVRCGDAMLQVIRYNAGPGGIVADGTAVSLHPACDAASLLAGAPP